MQDVCIEIVLHIARFNLNLTTFRETYHDGIYIVLFFYCSWFVSCKDDGLHFYINDIRDRNVNIPRQYMQKFCIEIGLHGAQLNLKCNNYPGNL